jgi:serine/threonine protein kinase
MPDTIGPHKVLDRIGAGGIGELYRARDTRHGRTVAIRIVSPDLIGDPERRDRFLRDTDLSAGLSHPNIATLYETGEDHGRLYVVSEFVPGETLRTVIGGRPLNARRAVEYAAQIADALADAHAVGVVHGDIKPETVILTPRGITKVLDFGLAAWTTGGLTRLRAATTTTPPSLTEAIGRTLPYMSPEQARGEPIDHRTDIFSLGVVLFEMLTGRVPFQPSTANDMAQEIVDSPLPAPTSLNKALPADVDSVVERMLAKLPDDRYDTAASAAAELRAIATRLDARASTAAPVPLRAAGPRSNVGWMVAAAILIVVVALLWLASRL